MNSTDNDSPKPEPDDGADCEAKIFEAGLAAAYYSDGPARARAVMLALRRDDPRYAPPDVQRLDRRVRSRDLIRVKKFLKSKTGRKYY